MRRLRFWRTEAPLRARSWWRRHWWPARIRQLDQERRDWKRWCLTAQGRPWVYVGQEPTTRQVAEGSP